MSKEKSAKQFKDPKVESALSLLREFFSTTRPSFEVNIDESKLITSFGDEIRHFYPISNTSGINGEMLQKLRNLSYSPSYNNMAAYDVKLTTSLGNAFFSNLIINNGRTVLDLDMIAENAVALRSHINSHRVLSNCSYLSVGNSTRLQEAMHYLDIVLDQSNSGFRVAMVTEDKRNFTENVKIEAFSKKHKAFPEVLIHGNMNLSIDGVKISETEASLLPHTLIKQSDNIRAFAKYYTTLNNTTAAINELRSHAQEYGLQEPTFDLPSQAGSVIKSSSKAEPGLLKAIEEYKGRYA